MCAWHPFYNTLEENKDLDFKQNFRTIGQTFLVENVKNTLEIWREKKYFIITRNYVCLVALLKHIIDVHELPSDQKTSLKPFAFDN